MSISQPAWSCPTSLPDTDYIRDSLRREVNNGSMVFMTFAGMEAPVDVSLSVYRGDPEDIRRWSEGANRDFVVEQVACWINKTTVTNATEGYTFWFGPLNGDGERVDPGDDTTEFGIAGDIIYVSALGSNVNASSDSTRATFASAFRTREGSAGARTKVLGVTGWGCLVLAGLAAVGCTL